MLIHLLKKKQLVEAKDFEATDINPLVKQKFTKSAIAIKQPYFRYQVSFHVIFDSEDYNTDDVKHSYFEPVNPKKKNRIFVLEDLNQIDTESEVNSWVEILELNGSSWSHKRIASSTFDLERDKTKGGSSYVELSFKGLSKLNMQNKNYNLCGNCCLLASLYPLKLFACRPKRF